MMGLPFYQRLLFFTSSWILGVYSVLVLNRLLVLSTFIFKVSFVLMMINPICLLLFSFALFRILNEYIIENWIAYLIWISISIQTFILYFILLVTMD